MFPGVYRLAIAPLSPRDDLLQAWIWSNDRGAISHERARALSDLSDVLPSRVQITVPPSFGRHTDRFDLHHAELAASGLLMFAGIEPRRFPVYLVVQH